MSSFSVSGSNLSSNSSGSSAFYNINYQNEKGMFADDFTILMGKCVPNNI